MSEGSGQALPLANAGEFFQAFPVVQNSAPRGPHRTSNLAKRKGCLITYRDVAVWRCDFFACPMSRSANLLRTESNTANALHGGGVTLAVLCRRAWDMAGGVP